MAILTLVQNPSLGIVCNMVYVLPVEYNFETKVEGLPTSEEVEMDKYKSIFYYIMNNGYVKEHNVFFERPDYGMKSHFKPLFIRAKIENIGINKVLVDGGETVELMSHLILNQTSKFDTDLRRHNMVLSKYEGKFGTTMGVIQVDLTLRTITRPTLFMVIASRANYHLLLGREWIQGIVVVPLILHQKISIWREDGIDENIEADQSYFLVAVNHVDKHKSDKQLT